MKDSLKTAGAACLAVGLVSTWDTRVEAQVPWFPGSVAGSPISFTGQITLTENLYDVYFLLAAMPCNPPYAALIANEIPSNTTLSFNITINSIWDISAGGSPSVGNYFAIAAVYNPTSGGVTLGMAPTQASSLISQGASFSGAWTEGYYAYQPPNLAYPLLTTDGGFSESTVASTLESGTYLGQPLNDSNLGGIGIDPNAFSSYFPPPPPFPPPPVITTYYYPQISTDPNNPSDFTLVNFSGASNGGSGFAVEVVPEPTTVSLLALGLLSCGWLRRRNS